MFSSTYITSVKSLCKHFSIKKKTWNKLKLSFNFLWKTSLTTLEQRRSVNMQITRCCRWREFCNRIQWQCDVWSWLRLRMRGKVVFVRGDLIITVKDGGSSIRGWRWRRADTSIVINHLKIIQADPANLG